MQTAYTTIASPVGELTLATNGSQLTALHIAGDRYFSTVPAGWTRQPGHPLLLEAARQLAEYFAARRRAFELELAPTGTPFQRQVWQALRGIPAGSTTTYAEIAAVIGRPSAARAVGTAVGRNPLCIIIPCHRVLASGGGFGGYVAGLACKQQLLDLEQRPSALTALTPKQKDFNIQS
jgi:methylated-DNA-[protein]-cysteine S-methyltransferase